MRIKPEELKMSQCNIPERKMKYLTTSMRDRETVTTKPLVRSVRVYMNLRS